MLDSNRMAHLHLSSSINKRKSISIDQIFQRISPPNLEEFKQEFGEYVQMRREYSMRQKRSSLLVEPCLIEDSAPIHQFAGFYRKLSNAPMSVDEHQSQLSLIEQVIKESIIIEWPRSVGGLNGRGEHEIQEVDCPPLIHRARNVVKCRSSHPTIRVKVCAISQSPGLPKTVEAFFRATLVKLSFDSTEPKQVAGRIILTQREGTPASKHTDHNGATVDSEGRVVASQAATDTQSYLLLDRYGESNIKTTPLKFENGVLCATFPEMGVALNSMIDRRQLATRYAIQVEVALNIDNKLIVEHIVHSHPFLIAITNDQTEPLLLSIFWHRLINIDIPDPMEATADLPALPWKVLSEWLKHFPKILCNTARSLHHSELLHLQCMLLLPRFVHCKTKEEFELLERSMFGNSQGEGMDVKDRERIRDRLLEEDVDPHLPINKDQVLVTRCVSLLDVETELKHSVWQWMFKATEMIMDVGHKLCPPPLLERKGSKTKRQLAATDEYLTMAVLFKRGLISFTSAHRACQVMSEINSQTMASTSSGSQTKAMLVRFCDENAGALSFAFASREEKPIFGSVTADQIKDFKQGLPEVLLDEAFPSKFDSIIRIDFGNSETSDDFTASLQNKATIFHYYRSQRQPAKGILVRDEETVRVNPLTGEILPRRSNPSPDTLDSRDEEPDDSQMSMPPNLFALMQQLAPSLPSSILPLGSPICTSQSVPLMAASTGFNQRIQLPTTNLFNQLLPESSPIQIFLKSLAGLPNSNRLQSPTSPIHERLLRAPGSFNQQQDFEYPDTDPIPAKRSPR